MNLVHCLYIFCFLDFWISAHIHVDGTPDEKNIYSASCSMNFLDYFATTNASVVPEVDNHVPLAVVIMYLW